MYCIHCGVKLADTEKQCPLCGTRVYHPDFPLAEAPPLYPSHRLPTPQVAPRTAQIILTTIFLLPLLITLLCDLRITGAVTWSGYVIGALIMSYVILVLPFWFRNPNPVIFVACGFAAVGLYVLYINQATDGNWFLTFAFPLIGYLGLVTTAVVALLRYVRAGRLYIFGGANIALGLFMPLMEYLICITFQRPRFTAWSLYPLIALVLLGAMLVFLGINKTARATMERKFFI